MDDAPHDFVMNATEECNQYFQFYENCEMRFVSAEILPGQSAMYADLDFFCYRTVDGQLRFDKVELGFSNGDRDTLLTGLGTWQWF